MRTYNDRKHLLLVNLLETIAYATTEVEKDDDGMVIPVFRWEPNFYFDEEDIQTIRELGEEEGMDFSQILGDDE